MAGLLEVPAMVREADEPRASLTEALVENLAREDLGALEEAAAFRQLIDDFGLTHDEVAEAVGRSRSAISNTVRLSDSRAGPPPARAGQPHRRPCPCPARTGGRRLCRPHRLPCRRGGLVGPAGRGRRAPEDPAQRRSAPKPRKVRPPPSSSSRPGCPSTSAPRSTSNTPPRAAGWSSGTVPWTTWSASTATSWPESPRPSWGVAFGTARRPARMTGRGFRRR